MHQKRGERERDGEKVKQSPFSKSGCKLETIPVPVKIAGHQTKAQLPSCKLNLETNYSYPEVNFRVQKGTPMASHAENYL